MDFANKLLNLKPALGETSAARESVLWGRNTISRGFDSGMFTNGAKIDADLGYGISIWNGTGVLTPQSSFKFSRNDRDQLSLGFELNLQSDIRFDLLYSQDYENSEITDRKIRFDSDIRW